MTEAGDQSAVARFRRPGAADGDGPRPWTLALPTAILVLVTALVGLDVAGDARSGSSGWHLALEVGIMAVALAGVVALWGQLLLARRRARALQSDLVRAEADLVRFRAEAQEALAGLGEAIDRQFERWGLSAAEREVALLLLKGLSHKEVAAARATSERTVRQQALAVYRKAGLSGRAELAAFFLEDLLLPAPAAAPEGPPRARGRSGART
jgi:DNA-binding CsgD family transcriptional regulator